MHVTNFAINSDNTITITIQARIDELAVLLLCAVVGCVLVNISTTR